VSPVSNHPSARAFQINGQTTHCGADAQPEFGPPVCTPHRTNPDWLETMMVFIALHEPPGYDAPFWVRGDA
jgi:hypothetical protein